jgi:hypothetical protein
VVHRICRLKPAPIFLYQLVFDEYDPKKVGHKERLEETDTKEALR